MKDGSSLEECLLARGDTEARALALRALPAEALIDRPGVNFITPETAHYAAARAGWDTAKLAPRP